MLVYVVTPWYLCCRHAASSYSHVELLRFLLDHGGDANIRDLDGDTPLLVSEEPEIFNMLVAAGADPRATNHAGDGILQKVFEDENEKMVMFLLENGYVNDPNFKFTPGQFELEFHDGGEEEDGDDDENA
jgi:ankyrin repeat protein